MQATIQASEASSYTVHLHQVEAVPGTHHLQITSAYAGAKNRDEQRVVFALTLDRAGLLALRDLIDSEVGA
ncbi:MAG: hypothetical protein RL227_2348 [Pseudomonadota bacterium]|jgi:hypothetical protein